MHVAFFFSVCAFQDNDPLDCEEVGLELLQPTDKALSPSMEQHCSQQTEQACAAGQVAALSALLAEKQGQVSINAVCNPLTCPMQIVQPGP